jgi:hypothetical protein
MEKVVNKTYIKDEEVTLIAERYATKIYQNGDIIYITYYDEIIAKIDPNEDGILKIYEEFKVNNETN